MKVSLRTRRKRPAVGASCVRSVRRAFSLKANGAASCPLLRSLSDAIALAREGRGAQATPIPTPAGWDAGSAAYIGL